MSTKIHALNGTILALFALYFETWSVLWSVHMLGAVGHLICIVGEEPVRRLTVGVDEWDAFDA